MTPIQWISRALSLGVKRPEHEVDHSPPTSAEVKKTWIYTFTPPCLLGVGTTLPFTCHTVRVLLRNSARVSLCSSPQCHSITEPVYRCAVLETHTMQTAYQALLPCSANLLQPHLFVLLIRSIYNILMKLMSI
jgi:hypothetical protein